MDETKERILKLEQSVDRIFDDVTELKDNVHQFQSELCAWFDRLDLSVQDLKLSQAKLEEQSKARDLFEKLIRDQLNEFKSFQSKILLAVTGGCISLVVWLVQDLLSR